MQNPSPFTVLLFYKYVSLLDITEEQKAQKKSVNLFLYEDEFLLQKKALMQHYAALKKHAMNM